VIVGQCTHKTHGKNKDKMAQQQVSGKKQQGNFSMKSFKAFVIKNR
jgi:hypothetical protein